MCDCGVKIVKKLPATNIAINRTMVDPFIDVQLNEPTQTTADKTFQFQNDEFLGIYLGKRKHGDIFKAPASVLAQSRFMTPDEFATKITATSAKKTKAKSE